MFTRKSIGICNLIEVLLILLLCYRQSHPKMPRKDCCSWRKLWSCQSLRSRHQLLSYRYIFNTNLIHCGNNQFKTEIHHSFQAVFFKRADGRMEILMAGPSHFSKELTGEEFIQEKLVYAEPFRLCSKLKNLLPDVKDKILIIERGDCTFVDKARRAQKAGAKAVIVTDNVVDSSADDQPMFAMSGDGVDDVKIPVVFIFSVEAKLLKAAHDNNPDLEVIYIIHVPHNWQCWCLFFSQNYSSASCC